MIEALILFLLFLFPIRIAQQPKYNYSIHKFKSKSDVHFYKHFLRINFSANTRTYKIHDLITNHIRIIIDTSNFVSREKCQTPVLI